MAHVEITEDTIEIRMTFADRALSFAGSFAIPLRQITSAFVSDLESLELQHRPTQSKGRFSSGTLETGVYANRELVVFAGLGDCEYLVIETRGERYKQIAIQLDDGFDPSEVARRIAAALPGAAFDAG